MTVPDVFSVWTVEQTMVSCAARTSMHVGALLGMKLGSAIERLRHISLASRALIGFAGAALLAVPRKDVRAFWPLALPFGGWSGWLMPGAVRCHFLTVGRS